MSVNGNEEPRWRDLSPIQFSCNYNYSLITHNKTPVHSTCGLLRMCAACLTPRLNLSSELCPAANNIQDTFPTGSAQDTTVKSMVFEWFGKEAAMPVDRPMITTNVNSSTAHSIKTVDFQCCKGSFTVSKTAQVGGHQLSHISTRQQCCM